jgi:hypothetical protein
MTLETKKIIAKEVIILTITGVLVLLCFGVTRLWNHSVNEQLLKTDSIKVSVDRLESFRLSFMEHLTPSDRKLWALLTRENLFTGDYAEFKRTFNRDESIFALFNKLSGRYYSKTFNEFGVQFFLPSNRKNIFKLLTDSVYVDHDFFFKQLVLHKDTIYQLAQSEGVLVYFDIYSKEDFLGLTDLINEHLAKGITIESLAKTTDSLRRSVIPSSILMKILVIGLLLIYPVRILWYIVKWSLSVLKQ